MANKKTKSASVDFEGALKQLESLVAKMESGTLNLDAALAHFEEGIALARQCQQSLLQAEQHVQTLLAGSSTDSEQEE